MMRTNPMRFTMTSLALWALSGVAMSEELYEPRVFMNDAGRSLNYRLMIPKDYSPSGTEKYPLVLFLHGAGERGNDNAKQLVHGTKDFAKDENRAKYPCFVIAPQCPEGKKWVEVDWSANTHKQPEESVSLVLTRELMASLQKEFRIDEKRLYVTGLSMGGYGTWDMITRTPNVCNLRTKGTKSLSEAIRITTSNCLCSVSSKASRAIHTSMPRSWR